jgi:hypothetical protein
MIHDSQFLFFYIYFLLIIIDNKCHDRIIRFININMKGTHFSLLTTFMLCLLATVNSQTCLNHQGVPV